LANTDPKNTSAPITQDPYAHAPAAVLQSGKLKAVATASMLVQGNATLGGAMSLHDGKLTSGSSGSLNAAADWSVFVHGTALAGAESVEA